MPYDPRLADRVSAELDARKLRFEERKMFGGIAYMVRGYMCVGIVKDDLMVRTGEDAQPKALRRPHARPMDFTGRPMKGYVFVAADGVRTAAALRKWIDLGVAYVSELPAKK